MSPLNNCSDKSNKGLYLPQRTVCDSELTCCWTELDRTTETRKEEIAVLVFYPYQERAAGRPQGLYLLVNHWLL